MVFFTRSFFYKYSAFIEFGGIIMRYIPDAAQMKAADQYTIQKLGVPSLELMENAALSCIDVMKEKNMDLTHVCVICGSGNNGGDGFAIARLLVNQGIKVTVVMAGNIERVTKETLYQIEELTKTGTPIVNEFDSDEYSMIIDAIFGVGLSRNIEGRYRDLMVQINNSSGIKFAVDIPSGISADKGEVLGIAFKADYTITFQAAKLGHLLFPGKGYCGEIIVKDIGISNAYFENDTDVSVIYEKEDYKKMLPERKEDSHKGTYGKLLIIAGSRGMSGAAYMNAISAYKCGAGLVQVYTVEENRIILQTLLPEAIITTYDTYNEKQLLELISWADTICIGSGLGMSEISVKITKTVIFESDVPTVIDADGLNILGEHMWYLLKKKHNQFIFTPHLKEMSRLTGEDIGKIKSDRKRMIEEFTAKYQLTCVLKDSRTLIKSLEERLVINTSGNSAMAKAGSGDVLAGIIAGLLVQTGNVHYAATLGTYLHGRCGDEARREMGSYSVMARDLIECISKIFIREEGKYYEKI